jgi:hypothetical protein
VAVGVDHDDVADAAQAADEREVRLVAGAENQCVALAEPVGELALEVLVDGKCAVRGARAGRARSVPRHRQLRRADDLGVQGQSEIVVRSEHERTPALDEDLARPKHFVDHRGARRRRAVAEDGAPALDRAKLVQQITHT